MDSADNAQNDANNIEFKHFDVVPEAKDHHYIKSNKSFLAKQCFTPQVYYRSHGYRLNPNLYANGRVCLSLINTWGGSTAERWTQKSTILQILVSIQGLVLNEKPFFNEPVFRSHLNSKSTSWITKSNCYNQDAFILSCKTMLQIMEKPPGNFEIFVAQHFRVRAAFILTAIKEYGEGRVRVGHFQTNATSSSSSSSVQVCGRFKANLKKVYSQLEIAFARLTSDEPTKMDKEEKGCLISEPPKMEKNKKKKGLLSKLAKWIWK
ncbi:hypothetical protein DH2020_043680 [Rehmannia glutinosa]|uniref:UBC core domain-containing protein n=1 Tax=Rehmannia glutinosa TaxID=99300 RepID=A0ABR0UJW0_REHGL